MACYLKPSRDPGGGAIRLSLRVPAPGEGATRLPGDALVRGTVYNATKTLACTCSDRANDCRFGVVRHGNGLARPDITMPGRTRRQTVFSTGRPSTSNSLTGNFARQRAGGVNAGGHTIDADARGHMWIKGHQVNLTELAPGIWEGGHCGAMCTITQDQSGAFISRSNARGEDGVCDVTALPVSDGGEWHTGFTRPSHLNKGNSSMRPISFPTLLLSVALLLPAPAALAQAGMRTESVHFAAGTTGKTIRGRITGYETVVYQIGAEAGQRLQIRLTTDNLSSYFNVYEPGRGPGGEALAVAEQIGPMVPDPNVFDGVLPTSGVYSVSVYMYRSAARRDETANYSLDISITGDTGEVVRGDFADGLQGGPDFWEVRLGDPGGTLNVHDGPSTGARTIGRLPNAAILRNLGCRMNEGLRWCQIEATAPGGITGWVAGDFLVESSGGATDGDAMVPGTPYNATGTIRCARSAEAAMQDCAFGVIREGAGSGNGSVTIDWPGGGARVIFFEAGTPASFDQSQADRGLEMTVTRTEDGISIVFIGQERFEIPDAVIWGG